MAKILFALAKPYPVAVKLTAGTQNQLPYKMHISDFLYSEN